MMHPFHQLGVTGVFGGSLKPSNARFTRADALLPTCAADTVIADKAYDADKRVLSPLNTAGKTAVSRPKLKRLIELLAN
jgi:hypothetical protein